MRYLPVKSIKIIITTAFFSFILLLFAPDSRAQDEILNYQLFTGETTLGNDNLILFRSYTVKGELFYIGVNPINLETKIIPGNQIHVQPSSWNQIFLKYANTPYVKAIHTAGSNSFSLQDAGIIHGFPKEKGVTLTIDLCPSHKPLDRIIFTSLITEFSEIEKPVPLALSVTGHFLISHNDDIEWIKHLISTNEISVVWVNHSFSHYYNPRESLSNNFLLKPGTDLNFEILQTEKTLLKKGILFSVFFRFPGLVSDHQVVDSVLHYGLIPIGSDAWLAKGQLPYNGSIVLIHGNGNEPLGITDFIRLLHNKSPLITKKEWLLYDLRESIENEFRQ